MDEIKTESKGNKESNGQGCKKMDKKPQIKKDEKVTINISFLKGDKTIQTLFKIEKRNKAV